MKANVEIPKVMSRVCSALTGQRPVKLAMGLTLGVVVLLAVVLYFEPSPSQGDSQNRVQQQLTAWNELTGELTGGVAASLASQKLGLPDYVEDPEEWVYDEQSRNFYGVMAPVSWVSQTSQAPAIPDYVEDSEEWVYDEQSRNFYGILAPVSQVSR